MDEIKTLKQQATQDQFKAFENKMETFFDKITEKVNNIQPPPPPPQQQSQYIQQQPHEPPIESMIELENKMEQFLTDLTKRVVYIIIIIIYIRIQYQNNQNQFHLKMIELINY